MSFWVNSGEKSKSLSSTSVNELDSNNNNNNILYLFNEGDVINPMSYLTYGLQHNEINN